LDNQNERNPYEREPELSEMTPRDRPSRSSADELFVEQSPEETSYTIPASAEKETLYVADV
jgi:hypothetical protein